MKNTLILCLLLSSAFILCTNAYPQSAVTGAISGTVSDPTKAVVPNAMVVLVSSATSKEETATTETAGRFRFTNLQPGLYTLTIKAAGFSDYKEDQVLVQVGRTTMIDAGLQVGGAQAEVSVVASAPLVNV